VADRSLGLTLEQTQSLKTRYMQQIFGQVPGGPTSGPGFPLIGNVYANITISRSTQLDAATIDELKKLDLSQLPPDVLQSFLDGKTPDLNKIPKEFLDKLISKTPQLFANIVSQVLKQNMGNESDLADHGIKGSIEGKSISRQGTYDVNSLDRKADISMYDQGEGNYTATMWTCIVLGVVGLAAIILIIVLCWRRQRNRRLQAARNGDLAPNSIIIDPKSIPMSREARENRLNEERSRDLRVEPEIYDGSDRDDVRSQRSAYTNQWVYDPNRQQHI